MKSHVVFNSHIKEFQRSVVSVRISPCYSLCLVFIPIPIYTSIHMFMYTNVIAVLKKFTVICFFWFLGWCFAISDTCAVHICSWSYDTGGQTFGFK